ncbi:MAG: gliding motility-associated C-terminal domain-containing protein [Flavobacteriales bacterium]
MLKALQSTLLTSLFACMLMPAAAQDVLLMTEDFELGNGAFTLNEGGPAANNGNNIWIVNDVYDGALTYPNTTTEDITNGGTISFAPTSNYLHIHDQPSGILNANYNASAAADRFAYTTFGVCTYGMSDVHMGFFYLCEGNAAAFGQVYYSIDGGAWTQVGLPQYNNMSVWQYSDLTLPIWDNVGNLRFGFRWQNNAGTPPSNISFAIDEITVVATQETLDPITITVTSVSPNPVCEGTFLTIAFSLSDTLCDGNYQIELSNMFGNFPSPFNSWVFNMAYPQTSGVLSIALPNNAASGDCYRIRINRLSPEPAISGIVSDCFEIIECPNEITTNGPVVALDTNAVCVGSAIDVPFFSTGIYAGSNDYVCQLSDVDGNFPPLPLQTGSIDDNGTYDPDLGSLPGNVSGLVPDTPPGCNYYLRVVSTNPVAIGTVWGPFCIQYCDITTNNTEDLNFCVSDCDVDPDGENVTIDIDVNEYGNTSVYGPDNLFTTQLLSSLNFGQIGENGILGEVAATDDCQLNIHVPCKDSLDDYGLPLGMNYMRIVATESSTPDNALGSLIRVTIGAYTLDPQIITAYEFPTWIPKDVFCVGETAILSFQPYNYFDNSTYMWSCNGINNGAPFVSPSGANSNTLYVNLGGTGTLTFSIQETNYGCVSPWTPPISILVLGDPNANIIGPNEVCEGELVSFHTNFYENTYYSWNVDAPDNAIAFQDTSNNELNIIFSEPGEYDFSVSVLNLCGSDDDFDSVTVNDAPEIEAVGDTVVCVGTPITLSAPQMGGYSYEWTEGNITVGLLNEVDVIADDSTVYIVTVIGPESCEGFDSVFVDVEYPEPPVLIEDSICPGGMNEIQLVADAMGTYLWSTGSDDTYILVNDTGHYSLVTNIAGEMCQHFTEYDVYALEPDSTELFTDSICPGGVTQITLMVDSTGTEYLWSTGETTASIEITDTGVYSVSIYTDGEPCERNEEYTVYPLPPVPPVYYTDSICPEGDNHIILETDTVGAGYLWNTGEVEHQIFVTETGQYQLLIFMDDAPCPRTLIFDVLADSCIVPPSVLFFVPNAFTPNITEGINDVFLPVFSDPSIVHHYKFSIYDRWGIMVWESTEVGQPWTGNFRSGEYFVQDGVYVWKAEYMINGLMDVFKADGHLTIVR